MSERTQFPHVKITPQTDSIDTGYACPGAKLSSAMIVSGPPPGVVSVGGYRFVTRKLQTLVGPVDDGSTLAALPDALAGHRLAGSAADREPCARDAGQTGCQSAAGRRLRRVASRGHTRLLTSR